MLGDVCIPCVFVSVSGDVRVTSWAGLLVFLLCGLLCVMEQPPFPPLSMNVVSSRILAMLSFWSSVY